jgi:two-component system, LytTR family, sensor kinase
MQAISSFYICNTMTKNIRYKWAIEIGYFLLLFILVLEGQPQQSGTHLFYSFLRFLILYVGASINRFFIFIPFFLKKKYIHFLFFSTVNLLLFSFIYYYYKLYYIQRFEPEFLPFFSMFTAVFFCILSTLLVCGIEFVFKFMQLQSENSKYQLASNQVVIKQLQSQLNPHFLFNSLNNAYGLSLSNPQKSSEYIMSLSQLMRYQIEGSKADSLLLENDMEFMHHYIQVEQQRVSKRCIMQFEDSVTQIQKERYTIAPLLFLPFVENAIKHGTATIETATILITFSMKENAVLFTCKNTLPTNKVSIQSTGTSLLNVRTRLNILYPQKHILQIEETSTHYFVTLKIEL